MTYPNRIVSMCPSITETLHALGAWAQVVGRTTYCVHPEGAVSGIATIGGTKRPNVEAICALSPDLVLFNEEENRREDAEVLTHRGLRVVSFFPKTLSDTADYIEALGALLGRESMAQTLASELRQEIARPTEPGPPIRFVYLIWRKPWMAVSNDTFISHLLAQVGFQNVIVGSDRYPMVTAESLRALDIDVVLLSSEPFPFADKHAVELADSSGLPRTRFQFVDGELLSWHGVRTIRGVKYARELRRRLSTVVSMQSG
ncbi:MAG: helical backbone metal receptor [Myxococcota bacterium]|nr:helical backbone metal receptor [Myxococcota bacterium]